MDAYLVAEVRRAEEQAIAEVGAAVLMQRAAAGLAQAILRRLAGEWRGAAYGARVLLVVGSGNNGGDALYAGVRLARRGVQVLCWRVAGTAHAEGWAAFRAAGGREVNAAEALAVLGDLDVVVDAVAGIGSRPGLDAAVAHFALQCRAAGVPVVAVDLPSGMAPEPPFSDQPCFTADLTVTFGGYKLCQLLSPTRQQCGRVELVEIGLEFGEPAVHMWEPWEVAALWPRPQATDDKYTRGVVGMDTGSAEYPGAAVLGCAGAVYAGAGMVRYLGEPKVAAQVVEQFPNVVTAAGRVQALVVGSGWADRKDKGLIGRAIGTGMPLVVDADALRRLTDPGHPGVLLTPHAGELAFVLGVERSEVVADPLTAVRRAADRTGCTVLLKGATQYVATPGVATVQIAVPGPAWSAQAGSGDVLAGVCGALLAAGLKPVTAAVLAASAQALVAEAHPGPRPPQEAAALLADWVGEVTHPDSSGLPPVS